MKTALPSFIFIFIFSFMCIVSTKHGEFGSPTLLLQIFHFLNVWKTPLCSVNYSNLSCSLPVFVTWESQIIDNKIQIEVKMHSAELIIISILCLFSLLLQLLVPPYVVQGMSVLIWTYLIK